MITKNYSFAMSVLYQTIRIILLNATNNLAALTAFKSKYSEDYINELKAELEAAETLKSEQARAAEHEALRIDLISLSASCRQYWQYLKRYIADAFGPEQQIVMWDAAGWQYYTEAANLNWDKLREMMQMASLFIEENAGTLKENGFMPDTFAATFEASRAAFNTKYDNFILAKENAEAGTAAKIDANNNINTKTVSLCLDAQICFMNDEVKKRLFSMEAVSSLIKPTGSATVVVELTDAETNAVIPVFDVTNLETERTVTSVAGRAEMGLQAEGSKQYRIVADGYPEQTITVDVKAGTKSIERISLAPFVGAAAKAEIEETAAPTPTPELVPVK